MVACSFCGGSSAEVWALVAGSGAHVCDACVADLREVVAEPASAPSPALFGPCQFCGSGPPTARLVVGSTVHHGKAPVVCGDCVGVCAQILGERIDLDGPWYRPLRFEGGHGIGPAGDDPDGVDGLFARALARRAEIDAWATTRLAELASLGLPAGPDVEPVVRRMAIAVLIGDLGVERGFRVPYPVAVQVAARLA